jgi:hypothetical protein
MTAYMIAGYLEWYDWGHLHADLDPGVGYIQDQLDQRGTDCNNLLQFGFVYTANWSFQN